LEAGKRKSPAFAGLGAGSMIEFCSPLENVWKIVFSDFQNTTG